LLNWNTHLDTTYFNNMDIPSWSIENPCKNPISAITMNLPETDDFQQPEPRRAGADNRQTGDNYQWVELQTSVQWRFFRRVIALLQERNNKVFVMVGPFNENRLEGANLQAYRKLQQDIESWFVQNNINYYIPPALPAELYVDASHPSAEGYALLAQRLLENASFQKIL
jgi:hypothetical protein